MLGTLMDIFAREGKAVEAESLFFQIERPDAVKYGLLIKAYGKCDKADRAAEVLQKLLQDDHVEPNVEVFNSLLNAWAESTLPEAPERAFDVMRLMEHGEKCMKLGLRPDVIAYNTLLKCLAETKSSDTCLKVEAILDLMERRFNAGDKRAKPNAISYNTAIKACFRAGEPERADAMLKRMEKSDTPPNIRTYNDSLHQYSQLCTQGAAIKSEQILAEMRDLADFTPSLKPDVFSYSLVLNAWARLGTANAAERMWLVYEQMKSENVKPDIVIYTSLITSLAKSIQTDHVDRAASLLRTLEDSKQRDLRPDYRQYLPVIKGFVNVGDPENATQVLFRFIEAYDDCKTGQDRPVHSVFHLLTVAWVESGDLVGATSFLEKIQAMRDTKRIPRGPDLTTYHYLLAAWNASKHPEADLHKRTLRARISLWLGSDD